VFQLATCFASLRAARSCTLHGCSCNHRSSHEEPSIKDYYTTVMDAAVKERSVLSYKLLQGARSNPQDFNFMIMIESPNMQEVLFTK
jgi:hypothetical protein